MHILENDALKVETSPCAGAIHSILVKGAGRHVTLTLKTEESHFNSPSYSGNTIFPFAGRIRGAVFDGIELEKNDGENALHGGEEAHRAIFAVKDIDSTSITYTLTRKAGQDRLPAECTYTATFSLDGNRLCIDYAMESSKPVLCDMTCHLYLNLSGGETVADHELKVDAQNVVINREDHTAERIVPVEGSPFDFRSFRRIGEAIDSPELAFSRGLNNAFILSGEKTVMLKGGNLLMKATSDSAAVVLYSGGYLEEPHSHLAIEFEDIPFAETRTVTDHFSRHIEFSFEVV